MNTDNVREWSVDDVADWLRREKFASYAGIFKRYRIDGIALCDLQKDRFDTLIRSSSMGREDRASMLWKNINIIKRAKSKNANSFNPKNNRKVPPQTLGPPEPPQRDYRTEIEEDIDTFTDDEIESDNGEYLEPADEGPRGAPQIPSRPTQGLNASWGQPSSGRLTDLDHDSELYLTPAEEDDTYDVPENGGHDDEIYDIPDDPSNNVPTPSSRQPPMSQQHNRHVMKQGPRIPPSRIPQFPKPGGHHHGNEPPAPPIPSRVQPQPITPEEEEEYAFPDEEPQDYIVPEGESSGDENYLEPELQPVSRHMQQNIQSRRLPTVPQASSAPVPPRPEKPSPLTNPVDVPPAIPSRPGPGRRKPNLENISHVSKVMPDFPTNNGTERSEPSRSPPRVTHPHIPVVPVIPSSINDNENENGNASSDAAARHVKNMRNRFEVGDNNNSDNARRPPPTAKFRSKPTDNKYPPPSTSPTHAPSPVVQRPVTSGGNSTPRKPGMPPSTSSTASVSSMSSSSSNESVPPPRQRKPRAEPDFRASEMPPLPPSTRRPSQPQLPVPNQSAIHQINERLAPSQPAKPTPSVSRAPPSPSRAPPPSQPQKVNELEGYPWYHADITRQESEKFLHQCRSDGAFMVRNSSRGDPANPYSLALWFNGRVRNLQIRLRTDHRYALGTRKEQEMAFETPAQLIEHHMSNSLILAQDEGKTILKVAAPVFR